MRRDVKQVEHFGTRAGHVLIGTTDGASADTRCSRVCSLSCPPFERQCVSWVLDCLSGSRARQRSPATTRAVVTSVRPARRPFFGRPGRAYSRFFNEFVATLRLELCRPIMATPPTVLTYGRLIRDRVYAWSLIASIGRSSGARAPGDSELFELCQFFFSREKSYK